MGRRRQRTEDPLLMQRQFLTRPPFTTTLSRLAGEGRGEGTRPYAPLASIALPATSIDTLVTNTAVAPTTST